MYIYPELFGHEQTKIKTFICKKQSHSQRKSCWSSSQLATLCKCGLTLPIDAL